MATNEHDLLREAAIRAEDRAAVNKDLRRLGECLDEMGEILNGTAEALERLKLGDQVFSTDLARACIIQAGTHLRKAEA